MKKAKPYLIATLILIVLVSGKLIFFPSEKAKTEKGAKESVASVTVFVIGDSSLTEKVYANGTLVANEQVNLKAEASGRIIYLNFPEGKVVEKGTLLLKLNNEDLIAQYDKNDVQLKLAKKNEERQRNLLQTRAISQQEYDVALASYNTFLADSAYYQAQIKKTEIRAPFTGILGIRNVSLGEYLTPSVVVAQIHQLNPIKIEFSLPEKYSSSLLPGNKIKFVDGEGRKYLAEISIRDPAIDFNSRTVRYRATCSNASGTLFPGAFVRVEIFVEEKAESCFIPTEAILPILKGKKVFVVKNGIAEERLVETGFRTTDHIQITSGLRKGDTVVVKGNYQLKDGNKVKIIDKRRARA